VTRQVTKDHTFVQRLVDLGRITEEEALVHPRRNVLLRVIGDSNEPPQLDFEVIETKPGDRWLMCSDGLNGYVADSIIARNMEGEQAPSEVVDVLIGEALEAGAPDNVTIVVADVMPSGLSTVLNRTPKFVGSAANDVVIQESGKGKSFVGLMNARLFTDLLGAEGLDRQYLPESGEAYQRILNETQRSLRYRRIRQWLMVAFIALLVVLAGFGAYSYTQTRYYVSSSNGYVAIYKGIHEELFGLKFSNVFSETSVLVASLPDYQKQLLVHTIYATDLQDAYRILDRLKAVSGGD
jgi:protein phosphatase